jgi:hypothetical protein
MEAAILMEIMAAEVVIMAVVEVVGALEAALEAAVVEVVAAL